MLLGSLDDATLAARAARGDDAAFAELARRYRGLISQTIRRPVPGLSYEDRRQEALLGLFLACRQHAQQTRWRFGAMATMAVRHRVTEARKVAMRRKHRLLTDALGIDHRRGDDVPTIAE